MPFISVNLNDASIQESRPAPAGKYDLQVLNVESATSKNGKPQLIAHLGFEGRENTPDLRHYMSLPANGDEPSSSAFKSLLLKRFATLFKVPYDERGFDTDAWIGARQHAEVSLSEPDDNGNVYNRLVTPRLADESAGGTGRKSPPPPKS